MQIQCSVLEKFVIKFCYNEEKKAVVKVAATLPSCAYAKSLRHFEISRSNCLVQLDRTTFLRILLPYERLETVFIFLSESNGETDIIQLLHSCQNLNCLRHFHFIATNYDQERSMKQIYDEQMTSLVSGRPFPALETLNLESIVIADEVLKHVLQNAPLLQSLTIKAKIISKRTVIVPTSYPSTISNESGLYEYVRKILHYEYETMIELQSRASIVSLLSPQHIASFIRYIHRGNIYEPSRTEEEHESGILSVYGDSNTTTTLLFDVHLSHHNSQIRNWSVMIEDFHGEIRIQQIKQQIKQEIKKKEEEFLTIENPEEETLGNVWIPEDRHQILSRQLDERFRRMLCTHQYLPGVEEESLLSSEAVPIYGSD